MKWESSVQTLVPKRATFITSRKSTGAFKSAREGTAAGETLLPNAELISLRIGIVAESS